MQQQREKRPLTSTERTILKFLSPATVKRADGEEVQLTEDPDSPESHYLMRKWRTVWMRTIAKAWAEYDEPGGFKDQLIANPKRTIENEFGDDGEIEFKLPFNLIFKVVDVEKQIKDHLQEGETYSYDWQEGWPDLPPNVLSMPLPPRPTNVSEVEALADYAGAGRTYPFTCCW